MSKLKSAGIIISTVILTGLSIRGIALFDTKDKYSFVHQIIDQDPDNAHIISALAYMHGVGVPKDYKKAETEFKIAADHGNAKAQYLLGYFYYNDHAGVPVNMNKARYYLKKSIDQNNNDDAQFLLGLTYMAPFDFTEKDDKQAKFWFEKAADQGNIYAQVAYAMLSRQATPYNRYDEKSLQYLKQAAENGSKRAQQALEGR